MKTLNGNLAALHLSVASANAPIPSEQARIISDCCAYMIGYVPNGALLQVFKGFNLCPRALGEDFLQNDVLQKLKAVTATSEISGYTARVLVESLIRADKYFSAHTKRRLLYWTTTVLRMRGLETPK